MATPKQTVIKVYNSLLWSLQGIFAIFKNDLSFRLEVYAAIIILPIVAYSPLSISMKLILTILVFLVFAFELVNSAIEACIDRCSMEIHPLAKYAKDAGSAAVFLMMMLNVIAWVFAYCSIQ